tara:strand:- start:4658 stop:5047 length:390 start_codon:yes stop_codon:yes gene_type:complete
MKPRYEETSSEVEEMLRKAQQLEKKIDTIEKARTCPCGSGKSMASCCPDVKKGEHHKTQSFGTDAESVNFMIETGGQTYNAFYDTNQSLLESTDVANKGTISSSLNLDALSRRMNTHDANTGHVVESGE